MSTLKSRSQRIRPRARPWWRFSVRLNPALGDFTVYATGPGDRAPSWYIPSSLTMQTAYYVAELMATSDERCRAARWDPVSPWW